MSSLRDKVMIITGAGSGIGAGAATHFAKLGCWLALSYLRAELLQQTLQDCLSQGLTEDKILLVPGDITDKRLPENIVSKTLDHFGKLDILLNIAGIGLNRNFENTSEEDLDVVMNVNFKAVYKMIQKSVSALKKAKGNIINVSSVFSTRPAMNCTAYSISKAAVDQLTRSTAIELAKYGIRVNAVNPGFVKTNLLAHMGMTQEQNDQFLESQGKKCLLGRLGTPDEIAKAMAFLASEDASFITGTNLVVDGGYTFCN